MHAIWIVAEDKIKAAIKSGDLDNLKGMGKPIVFKDVLPGMPEETKMAYQMLRNAGFDPLQVEKEIEEQTKGAKLDELLEERQTKETKSFKKYAQKIYNRFSK
ncbi:DnaJ family domain-containing protein [Alkalihalobacterium elongatum]|uniref:DnaJ family domain-containing protein n=1 Tax=Alkalihalobacterium elongatum TaxID=2675466 RepID=UPI001C1F42E9|nr:DUF1992 domain-containing protein [Alkalihalobacterium elongatum]